jgi:hypothetical protein
VSALRYFLATAAIVVSTSSLAEQPKMEAALDHLRQAKDSLMEASHDKGGHRGKAIQAINDAMKEVNAGIEYDKTHTSTSEKAAADKAAAEKAAAAKAAAAKDVKPKK